MIDASLALEITNLLLEAYYRVPGPDRTIEHVTMTRPRSKWDIQRMHEMAFVSFAGIIEPALLLRAKGPSHFADESISVAKGALRAFFRDHHYLIIDEVLRWHGDAPYADFISTIGKATLAAKLSSSEVFNPEERFLLFPLTPVSVKVAFLGRRFALVDPGNAMNALPDLHRSSTFE